MRGESSNRTADRGRGVCVLVVLWLLAAPLAAATTIDGVRMHQAPDYTRLVFDTSAPTEFKIFTLTNPHRVVIDILRVQPGRALAPESTATAGTAVHGIRAAPRAGNYRVVLDVAEPLTAKGFNLAPVAPYGDRLVVDLFAQRVSAAPRPQPRPPASGARDVVVVIDAGHGGEDPGAIGPGRVAEKRVVLAISQELKRLFDRTPGYRGELTRTGDYYIAHRRRTEIARDLRADLFVSVHADAFVNAAARGASVYTLSERGASSEAARWLAEKENASDLIGGVGAVSLGDKDDLLAHVLLDLSMDANRSASIDAGESVLKSLRGMARLHKQRVEEAGFLVLKSPDVPSILVETGFISNPEEARSLGQSGYQRKIARAMFDGIVAHTERKPPPGTLIARNSATGRGSARQHVIRSGDTLSEIANRYRVSSRRLREVNGLADDMIRIGQVLIIPAS
jgi:N-acetylmuramoyl-L-alanine amidase